MGKHVPANKEAEKGSRKWDHTWESPGGFWEIAGQGQDAGAQSVQSGMEERPVSGLISKNKEKYLIYLTLLKELLPWPV